MAIEHSVWDEQFYDNLTGEMLDPKLVRAAREEEMRFIKELGVK